MASLSEPASFIQVWLARKVQGVVSPDYACPKASVATFRYKISNSAVKAKEANINSGCLLTMPLELRSDTSSMYCMILYGNIPGQRNVTLTFTKITSSEKWVILNGVFSIGPSGRLYCKKFPVPPTGVYEVILRNSKDILHDPVNVTVLENKITMIQTDKPIYKAGQKVRFRVLTLLTSSKLRTSQIRSIFIRNSGWGLVAQYLNLTTNGILQMEFQIHKEASEGYWRIEVNLDEDVKVIQKITVQPINRFKVIIESPSYILPSDKIISGRVCSRYFSGEYVTGKLFLEFCRMYKKHITNNPIHPCYRFKVRVIVTKPDGTRASWKKIVVTAKSWEHSQYFSRNFITNKYGEIDFALCGDITEVTSMRISAQAKVWEKDENVSTNIKISSSMNF
ncbi:alpha-2-macroglobulin-like protein [Plakobranchus ocellatus]|uniref:Alpha-2-macroglobulin-like protein n=1 Tax=Plakobranchus ocellatus TaxID=259542 RepID=A0AAV4BF36_9GAST|nr:alpha-2-macroglobulin-like protein [Plakobranchus ocellatus]